MTMRHNRTHQIQFILTLLLIVGVLVFAGCSYKSKKVNISGQVTCKGEAIGWGNVRFFSSDGTLWSSARLNPDGTFIATDVPQGEIQVALQPLPIPPAAKQKNGAANADAEMFSYPEKFVPIPPKYQDPKTANLHCTIDSGDNTLNIELQ